MRKCISFILFLTFTVSAAFAQEVNATVTVNSSKVQGNKQLFNTLQKELHNFINHTRWTTLDFRPNEKIDCSFLLVIDEMTSQTSFKGELHIQSRRPVFNTTYQTPLLNYRDRTILFDYIEHQQLEYISNSANNNLASTIAYYIYLILGLDFDSMSPMGGTSFYHQMELIAMNAQNAHPNQWESSTNRRNKLSIAKAFNEPVAEPYRKMWYDYHRLGLDEMADNIEKGGEKVVTSLTEIVSLYSQRPNSILITLFGDAKLDELVTIIGKESLHDNRQRYETLRTIYPSRMAELESKQ